MGKKIEIKKSAQEQNQIVADQNRTLFARARLTVFNMISSPGSGKTSILEVLGKKLGSQLAVITGDIQMRFDAERIKKSGAQAVQIETGGSCHLNARQVQEAYKSMDIDRARYLVIENVGNLVCPSTFDLGEGIKLAVVSVTEGDEKPIKYPALFTRAAAVIFNKIDLLPYVDFNMDRAASDCKKLNHAMQIFKISCKTGEGFDEVFKFLEESSLPGV